MFQNIGFTEILLIAIVGLLLFGPQKLPELEIAVHSNSPYEAQGRLGQIEINKVK